MKTTRLLPFLLAAACTTEIADPAPTPTPTGQLPPGPEWDETQAARAEPCGAATVATCGEATHGACGVVAPAGGAVDACLPLFAWGVTADGQVEFASSSRRFTLDALATAPLSDAELEEAAAMADALVGAEPATSADEPDGELDPLAAINHTGFCSTSYNRCDKFNYKVYVGHYNYLGGHYHSIWLHDNPSQPWYYCNVLGKNTGSLIYACGTP